MEYKVYYNDEKPPNRNNGTWLIVSIIIMLIAIAIFSSCYTQKKAAKQLNKAHDNFPSLTAQDLSKWFPPSDTSDYSIGQLDSVVDPMTAYYKQKADSLEAIKQKVKDSVVVKDTCEMIGASDYDEGYNYGVQFGYAKGKSECKPSTVRIDTIYKTPSTVLVNIDALKSDTTIKHDVIVKLQTQYSDQSATLKKSRIENWILLGIIIGFIGFKIFNYFYKPTLPKL